MNIGDKVRMLHGREQGVITRILPGDIIEVAIDNDFTIPVSRRDVVIIAADEAKAFSQEITPSQTIHPRKQPFTTPETVVAEGGIFLAFVNQTPELLALHLINNSDTDLLYTFGELRKGNFKGLSANKVSARSNNLLGHYHLGEFENWPEFAMQWLQFRTGSGKQFSPRESSITFNANTFYKAKKQAPQLNKPAFVFELDARAVAVDAAKLKEQLTEGTKAAEANFTAPLPEVDLHIQELTAMHESMDATSILMMQLQTFETAIDRAIGAGMHEITFIHGAGNGVLRKEIQKRLSNLQKQKQIKHYEDARREKFGYGATKVKII